MPIRARVERLAPTGEGVVRTNEGVGLVDGVLPGEEVDVEVVRVSAKIWRGRALSIDHPSPVRMRGGHADGCPACDWAHVDAAAARDFKLALFFETMGRIGRISRETFGDVAVEPSPAGYRLRSRFHAGVRPGREGIVVGAFAPRTHRVEPLDACEALSEPMRRLLPRIGEALARAAARASVPLEAGAEAPFEISTVETLDASRRLARVVLPAGRAGAERVVTELAPLFAGVEVADPSGRILHGAGEERFWLPAGPGGREVAAAPGAFFQANRFLLAPLAAFVRDLVADSAAGDSGTALDAFGGSGLFAASLLDAGYSVTSVEADASAVDAARLARDRWRARDAWRLVRSPLLDFARRDSRREDVVVADPPRVGLGAALSKALAARTKGRFVYVSCDPATLARDLSVFLAEGFEIRTTRLFDLFALTHRVEAVVLLERVRGPVR
jgi:23S rRNA (uracil1939-C5)-methyltransferase